ncbi:MAG: nucleotidyltransferase domain-containing protein [Myxococcota bacterium]
MLDEYRRRLDRRFGGRLTKARLFGSRARGDADPDSDIDVAVVVRDLTEPERTEVIDLALEAWRATGRSGPLVSPLVWSDREFAELLALERRVALDVEREGAPI